MRTELLETAARILADEGPTAMSTRRLAREVGTSTMAVYTHFGGKEDLVRAMCVEGFDRLARRMRRVRSTNDPVADCAELGRAYRRHALANPHLYRIMFGGRTVADYQPGPDDRAYGLTTLTMLADSVGRCIEAGRFAPAEPFPLAVQLWTVGHGVVSLELDGFFDGGLEGGNALELLAALTVNLIIGFGDDPARAPRSVARRARQAA